MRDKMVRVKSECVNSSGRVVSCGFDCVCLAGNGDEAIPHKSEWATAKVPRGVRIGIG